MTYGARQVAARSVTVFEDVAAARDSLENSPQTPFVLRGAMEDWPARSWTPQCLSDGVHLAISYTLTASYFHDRCLVCFESDAYSYELTALQRHSFSNARRTTFRSKYADSCDGSASRGRMHLASADLTVKELELPKAGIHSCICMLEPARGRLSVNSYSSTRRTDEGLVALIVMQCCGKSNAFRPMTQTEGVLSLLRV